MQMMMLKNFSFRSLICQSSESKALITCLVVFLKKNLPAFLYDYVVTLPWKGIRAVINQNTSSDCKTSPVNKNTKFLPYIICLLFFKYFYF